MRVLSASNQVLSFSFSFLSWPLGFRRGDKRVPQPSEMIQTILYPIACVNAQRHGVVACSNSLQFLLCEVGCPTRVAKAAPRASPIRAVFQNIYVNVFWVSSHTIDFSNHVPPTGSQCWQPKMHALHQNNVIILLWHRNPDTWSKLHKKRWVPLRILVNGVAASMTTLDATTSPRWPPLRTVRFATSKHKDFLPRGGTTT